MSKRDLAKQMAEAGTDGRRRRTVRNRRAPSARQAWTTLTADELARPGAGLLRRLFEEANGRNMSLSDLATELGCTYGYIAQLKGGHRETRNISRHFASACAHYLRVPVISVLTWAEQVQPQDFVVEPETLDEQVDKALGLLADDKRLGRWWTDAVVEADPEVKHLVARLYEAASKKKLIS